MGTPGQKFCGECGSSLGSRGVDAAPAESTLRPATSAPVLVSPTESAKPADVDEERRLITAIFCDLVGFTPLSEALDPEEVREIQTMYFSLMNAELHRFGGSVEKYAGDAVLALFGAPIAHEDDAERAVRCALAMQQAFQQVSDMALREWDRELAIRIGVNTGEAISGAWDVEGMRNYSATGDVVNTAARLQTAADPGGVIVGQQTMLLARRAIIFGPRRDLTLKGKSELFPAYPVVGLREHLAERWEVREQSVPFVGRESEMLRLMESWARVTSGSGRIFTVVAEAGVGKSRLIAEAIGRMSTLPGTVVVRGRCLSFGAGMSLHLVADLIRTICQIHEGDEPERQRAALYLTVDSLLAPWDSDTRDAARGALTDVLGLSTRAVDGTQADPKIRRQALVASLRMLLSALSTLHPAIVLLEDLHWIDDASADVIADVLPSLEERKAMILISHRPGWQAPWADRGNAESLALAPLTEDVTARLAQSILGDKQLDPQLARQLADRAAGNPFFLEELLLNMQEAGALEDRDGRVALRADAADKLPATLTELLLARLDELERDARAVAQQGAVIGRTFATVLAARATRRDRAVLIDRLETLEQAGIAFARTPAREEFTFKHATVREVAYNTLLVRKREALHASTARALIELYSVDEHLDLIAYHFDHSREHAEAAHWLERAADRAASVYANDGAIANYELARARMVKAGTSPEDLARVDVKLGRTLKLVSRYDDALRVLERGSEEWVTAGDQESERLAVAEIGRVHRARGTPSEGIDRVLELIQRDIGIEPTSGVAALHVVLARLYFNLGRYQEQLTSAEVATAMAGDCGERKVLAEAEMSRGIALFLLGNTDSALQIMHDALPVAEEVGDVEVLNILLGNLSLIYRDTGDFGHSREYREQSARLTERTGDIANHSFALASLGELLFFLGDWTHAEESMTRALAMVQSLGSSFFSCYPPLLLGYLLTARGEYVLATHHLDAALTMAREGEQTHYVRRILDCLAEIDLLQGRPDAALERLEGLVPDEFVDVDDSSLTATLPLVAWAQLQGGDVETALTLAIAAVERAERERALVELLAARRILGMVHATRREWEHAFEAFEAGIDLARRMQYPHALARILFEYSRALELAHRSQDASAAVSEAEAVFSTLGLAADREAAAPEVAPA